MTTKDVPIVLQLNQSVVHLTSPLDAQRLDILVQRCDLRLVAESKLGVVAFILGLSEGRGYDNANYRWFSQRLRNFLYVDRIVVSDVCRGQGIGQQLYAAVYQWARNEGAFNVCAEIDQDPPNHESLRFHEQAGFVEIGSRVLETDKKVSMQIRPLMNSMLDSP